MSLKPAQNFSLKIAHGADLWRPVRNLLLKQLHFQAEPLDQSLVTHSPWRGLLGGSAMRSLQLQAEGLIVDEEVQEILRSAYFEQSLSQWEIAIRGIGQFRGPLILTQLSIISVFEQELKFSLGLQSAGPIVFSQAEGGDL